MHTHIKSHTCVSKVMFIVFFGSEGPLLLDFQSCTKTPSANNYYLTVETPHTMIKNTCQGKLHDGIILLLNTVAHRVQHQLNTM
jgi:hypothetical protein